MQGYGLTETSPVVAVNSAADNRPETVGQPLPGVAIKIAANGELLIKGDCVMAGYWQNPAATAAIIDGDGWLHSGDLASITPSGHIAITGRILGIKLADAVAHTGPEAIFLFGGLAEAGDLLLEPTRRALEEFLFRPYRGKVQLRRSAIPADAGALLGAGALIWQELMVR